MPKSTPGALPAATGRPASRFLPVYQRKMEFTGPREPSRPDRTKPLVLPEATHIFDAATMDATA
jgi:hypothetical protein